MLEERPFAPLVFLLVISAAFGLVISMGLLSGDAQGRVNVLLLLALFVGLPLIMLVFNLLAWLHPSPPLMGYLLALFQRQFPVMPASAWLHWRQSPRFIPWLQLQSQYAAIAYALGSLLGLLLLLLFSDINFVWRSTLLTPEQLLPLLSGVAKPWGFWSSAQPSFDLLSATQDSRLHGAGVSTRHADWWPFIVATQLFYVLFLRTLMAFLSAWQLWQLRRQHAQIMSLLVTAPTQQKESPNNALAQVCHALPSEFVWINWAGIDARLWQQLEAPLAQRPCLFTGPMATVQQQIQAQQDPRPQVLLVKAWEPPLAELGDYMREVVTGFIVPLDMQQQSLRPLRPQHLEEWRRFVAGHRGWQVFLPRALLC